MNICPSIKYTIIGYVDNKILYARSPYLLQLGLDNYLDNSVDILVAIEIALISNYFVLPMAFIHSIMMIILNYLYIQKNIIITFIKTF